MNTPSFLRTPENRFEHLNDYAYEANYVFIDGLRMHYVDENKHSKKVIVLVHGEPTWGYLYRKMIPLFVAQGFRVVVPDLIGFGKSDKLKHKKEYTYSGSVKWLEQFLFEHLQLHHIHFVLHDWGGLIGLRIVANYAERFASVIALNTAFPRMEGFNPAFTLWRLFFELLLQFPISRLIPLGMRTKPDKTEMKAYDAPFPDKRYKTAPLQYPKLVPLYPWNKELQENKRLWEKLGIVTQPFLTIYAANDPFTKRVEEQFIAHIPGALNQPHIKIANAGHYLQEDKPHLVCEHIIAFIAGLNNSKQA